MDGCKFSTVLEWCKTVKSNIKKMPLPGGQLAVLLHKHGGKLCENCRARTCHPLCSDIQKSKIVQPNKRKLPSNCSPETFFSGKDAVERKGSACHWHEQMRQFSWFGRATQQLPNPPAHFHYLCAVNKCAAACNSKPSKSEFKNCLNDHTLRPTPAMIPT